MKTFLKISATLFLALAMVKLNGSAVSEYDQYNRRARLVAVNHLIPQNFDVLFAPGVSKKGLRPKQAGVFLDYYDKITEFYPHIAEAFGLKGYCFYLSGDTRAAIESYKEAVALRPEFFWFQYNLGLLYFKLGAYGQAVGYFQSAVNADIDQSLFYIRSSKAIYAPLLARQYADFGQLKKRTQQARADCYVLLILSYFHLKDFNRMMFVVREPAAAQSVPLAFSHYYIGRAAEAMGAQDAAAGFFQQAMIAAGAHSFPELTARLPQGSDFFLEPF